MSSFVPLVAFGGLVYALIQFLKQLAAKNWQGVINQAAVWIAGVAVTILGAHTQFADGIAVGGQALGALSMWSQIFVGLTVAGTASTAYSFKQAVDNTDTDAIPASSAPVLEAAAEPSPADQVEYADAPPTDTVAKFIAPKMTEERPTTAAPKVGAVRSSRKKAPAKA